MSIEKKHLRARMIEERARQPKRVRAEKAVQAAEIVQYKNIWKQCRVIAGYIAFRGELDPAPLLKSLDRAKIITVYPRITPQKTMVFSHWHSGDPLDTKWGNLRQPKETAVGISIKDIDVILVPLLACDNRGYRLGYGGGFYDRALEGVTSVKKIGFGYSFQRCQTIKAQEHDVPLDGFASERGLEWFNVIK